MAIGKDVPTVIARQTYAYEMPITNVKAKTSFARSKKYRSDLFKYNSKGVMFEASFVEMSLFSSISITIYRAHRPTF